MGLILESSGLELLCIVLILLWCFYIYVTLHYDYWKKRSVPSSDGVFPFGSLTDVSLGKIHIGEGFDQLYRRFKNDRYFGILDGRDPTLVVKDPDLIKQILVKDFRYFSDRLPPSSALKKQYINNHLFNMTGQEWRKMRLTLTPTFTSGKMKMMFSLMDKCCEQLQKHMDAEVDVDSIVNVKDILARFTMGVIGTCAFGLDINCLSNKNCEFYKVGVSIFKTTKLRMVRRLFYKIIPFLSKVYAPNIIPTEINELLTKMIQDTVRYREENNLVRNDFLDLLIKIRQNKSVADREENSNSQFESKNMQEMGPKIGLTIEEITAQSFIFFAAGFETASSTASFCLYELCCNQMVQEKLYQEIKEVLSRHGGKPTYQALQEMNYMDQVINETLRLYASLSVLNRICTEPYKIPDSELILEKGTMIVIPVFSIHHDSKYYPDPYKFDPERFTPERIMERHPFLHLPFGEGPRMCIGMRFGLLQTKIALTTMVYNYHFGMAPETEVPIKILKKAIVTLPENPVLRVTKRNNNLYEI